jgi:hypothetical protein
LGHQAIRFPVVGTVADAVVVTLRNVDLLGLAAPLDSELRKLALLLHTLLLEPSVDFRTVGVAHIRAALSTALSALLTLQVEVQVPHYQILLQHPAR